MEVCSLRICTSPLYPSPRPPPPLHPAYLCNSRARFFPVEDRQHLTVSCGVLLRKWEIRYLKTNAQLSSLIYGLSGKMAAPRTSKKVLVARIEKLQAKAAKATVPAAAAKGGVAGKSVSNKKKPSKRGCVAALSPGMLAEMQRVATMDDAVMAGRFVTPTLPTPSSPPPPPPTHTRHSGCAEIPNRTSLLSSHGSAQQRVGPFRTYFAKRGAATRFKDPPRTAGTL